MKLIYLLIIGCFVLSVSFAEEREVPQDVKTALYQLLAGNGENDGSIVIANYTETTLKMLSPLNRFRLKNGQEMLKVKWGEKIVIVSGTVAQKMKEIYMKEMGVRAEFVEDIEDKFMLFTGNVAKLFEQIIKTHLKWSGNILKKELGLAIGNITYGLTMQLVKEMILRRIGLHAAILFPLTMVIDLIPVIVGTAAAIVTAPILGGAILIEAVAYGLFKILQISIHGIIKVGKWIVSKIKSIFHKNEEAWGFQNRLQTTWNWDRFFEGAEAGKEHQLSGQKLEGQLQELKYKSEPIEFIEGFEQGYLKAAFLF